MSLNSNIEVPYEIPTLCYTAGTVLIILLFKIWRKAVYLKGEQHVLSLPSPHAQSKPWFQHLAAQPRAPQEPRHPTFPAPTQRHIQAVPREVSAV